MFRIGHGYDAHRLVAGRKLILGGVEIAHVFGLDGHSDADVLAHAIIDALLGAAGLGDIGRHFPPSDEKYKGADSLALLADVMTKISPLKVINVDATIIAEAPKLAEYIPQMAQNLMRILKTQNVNIKATTTEKMGFEGCMEGISAHAVCLLEAQGE